MTRASPFHLLDVFTDRPFSGNPLAVVEDADDLSDAEMLAIAREFNFSETAFLSSPRDPLHTARLRIFTPGAELPFAGHPTIGAAVLLAETRAGDVLARSDVTIALEASVGVLRCEALRGRSGVTYAQFAAPLAPRRMGPAPARETLAAALSLAPNDIGFGAHVATIYSAGAPILFAPISSREALDRARRAPDVFARAAEGTIGVYLYAQDDAEAASAVHARMFAHGLGFDEDPATGAAAAAFAGVAVEFEKPDDGEHQLFIEQGRAMGRPSRITLRMSVDAGALAGVSVGGQAVRVGEGTLRL